jgi:hypothetical protein
MIGNNAQVLGALAKRDYDQFLSTIAKFALMQVPTSVINNALKYHISTLALQFQERCISLSSS